jgi:hypothetical protein
MLTVAPIRSRFLPLAVRLGRSCNCGNSDFPIPALEPDLADVAHISLALRLTLTFHDALICLVLDETVLIGGGSQVGRQVRGSEPLSACFPTATFSFSGIVPLDSVGKAMSESVAPKTATSQVFFIGDSSAPDSPMRRGCLGDRLAKFIAFRVFYAEWD